MSKAVILARVSTLKQEKEGLSLKDIQLPELRDYANKNGLDVVQEFVFSESADRKIRKRFDEMMEFVKQPKNGIQAIITYRVDRITRNYRDAVLIDELRLDNDIEIHFVYDHLSINKKSVGRDIQDWDLKVFLAKQYINRLKEDAANSAKVKLRNFEWPGKAPYGYNNVDLENKKKWIEINENEAPIVKKMYELYGSGSYSLLEIRTEVKYLFNVDFHKGKIDHILKNPFYCGTMRYDSGLHPHHYDRIVSEELFQKVQDINAGYHKKHFKFAGLPYAYRGLINCSVCGCSITPEKKKGQYIYYHCTQYHGKHGAEWLREEELTAEFSKMFSKLKLPKAALEEISASLKDSHRDKTKFHKELVTRYQTEIDKYENRIERMYEDKLDRSITESQYEKKRDEYRLMQRSIEKKLAQVHIADEEYYMAADHLLRLASQSNELFKVAEPKEKRLLIKLTLQNLKLDGRKPVYDWIKPFDKIAYYASRHMWLPG